MVQEKGLHVLFSAQDAGVIAGDPGIDLTLEAIKRFDAAASAKPAAARRRRRAAAPATTSAPSARHEAIGARRVQASEMQSAECKVLQ